MRLVTLSDRQFPVVAQRHARLRHYLTSTDWKRLISRDYGQDAYRLLTIFIPAIKEGVKESGKTVVKPMPEWEFNGFPSDEAWQRYKGGDLTAYEDDADNSPHTDEIFGALAAAVLESGVDKLQEMLSMGSDAAKVAGRSVIPPQLPGGTGQAETPT